MSPWAIAQNPFERLLKLNQNKRKEKKIEKEISFIIMCRIRPAERQLLQNPSKE
jgi:hypothetical protein